MSSNPNRLSIFEQTLDRASSTVYFLGAVVPLGALAWLWLDRTNPTGFRVDARWFIGALGLIGGLTLLSFFALRRLTRASMRTIDRENESLARMLNAARALAAAKEATEVCQLVAQSAAEIASAQAGACFVRNRSGALELVGRSRSDGAAEPTRHAHDAEMAAAAEQALASSSTHRRDAEHAGVPGTIVAVPCVSGDGADAALAVWLPRGETLDAARMEILSTLSSLTAVSLGNADLRETERNFFTHATNLLVATLDRYLDDRSDHSRRVAAIANQISHALKLPEGGRERLHFAALLHDIGMLGVPRGHADDKLLARRHAEVGDQMLRPIRIWEDLAPIVRHHHERWDGAGYPDGLAGEAIPLESRIIAVAEAFDAMTSEKSYKPAIPVAEALERIEQAAGSQFDPAIAVAFLVARRESA